MPANTKIKKWEINAKNENFETIIRKIVAIKGEPSYISIDQKWKGAAPIFIKKDTTKTTKKKLSKMVEKNSS